jgi:RimJ/RimL family protein N-acetyltransferase
MTLPASPVSARLRYEPVGDDDVVTLSLHWGHPDVYRFLFDGEPPDLDTVEALVQRSREHFAVRGVGLWRIESIDGGEFLGTIGLLPVPDGSGDIEVLYSLEPACWGRGFASEATAAVARTGFAHAGLDRIYGGYDEPNDRSRNVLERTGFRPAGERLLFGNRVSYAVLQSGEMAR